MTATAGAEDVMFEDVYQKKVGRSGIVAGRETFDVGFAAAGGVNAGRGAVCVHRWQRMLKSLF